MSKADYLNVLSMPTSIIAITTLFTSAYLLYQWLLPKPIPGIPYNEEAARSIFGDITSLRNYLKGSKVITDWMLSHNKRHDSPIVQVFANLFGTPWVIISDSFEAQDIVMRRTKEFDKPDDLSDMFYSIAPDHHTVQPTNDQWRAQRKLIQDLISSAFLNSVAAQQLHTNFSDLITLWSEKMRLSEGRAFNVKADVYNTALEAIWACLFGLEGQQTVTREQIEMLSQLKNVTLPSSKNKEAVFDGATVPPAFDAIFELAESLENVVKSPLPRMTGLYMRYIDSGTRRKIKLKDDVIHEQITKAEKRMEISESKDKIHAAVDHMLRREKMVAEKQNRNPDYHSKYMSAELFGLLIAGHDTTSTTLLWALKFLAHHDSIQTRLRTNLQTSFSQARSESRLPSAHEIATSNIPYMDACIEEILRHSKTGLLISRTATTDAMILGHIVPKGTRVYMMLNGPGVLEPAYKIPDTLRSPSFHATNGGKTSDWDARDVKVFNPERWLVGSGNGKVFNAQAGPQMAFGGGKRGCFGKRLAYLELKTVIALIVWSFVLEKVPEQYAGWEAMDQLTHQPVDCYVKLRKV
ncbi:cytochrome P450 monooxygenase [Curvularia clavata]|uniref:Cytochrome P450 monooxygenase n=1 Tax=Curvularia clavata TaxID=95742 RepID=A0A9Q8ZBI6_CURCL|nr:cytochrome P450 monooxygenase [Curvularia clavata]